MKKLVLLLSVLLSTAISYAQDPVLIGFKILPCDYKESVNLEVYQKRIISQEYRSDTLEITLTTVMNCCDGDTGMLKYTPDTLFFSTGFLPTPVVNENGDTIGWDEPQLCDCECCFTMTYTVAGLPQKDYVIVMNGKPLELRSDKYAEPGFMVRNGDTLYYNDSEGFMYSYSFGENGKVKFMKKSKYPKFFYYTYYESGNLKSVMEINNDWDIHRYLEYNDSGKLIKYENTLVTGYYKTFSSKKFEVGDKILAPEIVFSMSGGEYVLPAYIDSVKTIADFLMQHPEMRIEIGVHTDSRGNEEYNDTVSYHRAESIKDVLVWDFKIDPDVIEIKGYGEQQPLVSQDEIDSVPSEEMKETMHRINRRVEVKILSK